MHLSTCNNSNFYFLFIFIFRIKKIRQIIILLSSMILTFLHTQKLIFFISPHPIFPPNYSFSSLALFPFLLPFPPPTPYFSWCLFPFLIFPLSPFPLSYFSFVSFSFPFFLFIYYFSQDHFCWYILPHCLPHSSR